MSVKINSTGGGSVTLDAGSLATNPVFSFPTTSGELLTNSSPVSGGTANGVAYLNGSKVLTTGSALTFNGTSFGVGSSDYGNAGLINLSVGVAGTTAGGLQLWATNANSHYVQFGDATAGAAPYSGAIGYNHSVDALLFYTSSAEQMRLTSTGLGIGTSSMYGSSKLSVNGDLTLVNTGGLYFGSNASSATGIVGNNSTNFLYLLTGNATRATIDPSGNLGLGVTPSAWSSGWKAMQIGNWGSVGAENSTTGDFSLLQNAYGNAATTYVYRNTSGASRYTQVSGAHSWYTAPSGTAGNAITFTQAMTLDASGNLYVGATSAAFAEKFQMYGNYAVFNNASYTGFIGQGSSLGTGTASDFAIRSSNALAFLTGGATERMRIDSSGNLLVGTTTDTGRLAVKQADAGAPGLRIYASSSTFGDNAVLATADRNTTNNSFYFYSAYNNTAAAYKFRVADSGNVTNTNNSYGAISDVKLKENISDATPKLDELMQVKVRNYNIIGDSQKQLGVIAQELEQVFPSMVDENVDCDAEGNDLGTSTKSVKYSVFVPILIKAVQEQQAIIESLTNRVAQLEGK